MDLFILAGLIVGYFIPMLIADNRKTKNKSQVAIINVFLGWTFIGWVVALVMAFSTDINSNFKK